MSTGKLHQSKEGKSYESNSIRYSVHSTKVEDVYYLNSGKRIGTSVYRHMEPEKHHGQERLPASA